MGKKITQLATITEVADDDLIVGVDVSDTSGSDNGTNKKFTKATLLDGLAPLNPQLTGWNPDAETWVYHNVDDPTGYFKIEGKDVSANYSVGWRIMFTNGGNVIKGIITAITYSDPDTIITFLHEIDPTDNQALYLLTNSAITENYFSPHKAPLGFPLDPDKWTEVTTYTGGPVKTTSSSWAEITSSFRLIVPIGAWNVAYEISGGIAVGSSLDSAAGWVCMSSSSSSVSHSNLVIYYRITTATATRELRSYAPGGRSDTISLSSKTTFYLLGKAETDARVWLFGNSDRTGVMRATCAYL